MFEKTLPSTKRKVKIRELTEDQIADLEDIPEIYFIGLKERTIRHQNKANLAWIRAGLGGGDFKDWTPNGTAPPDSVIKQLSKEERSELVKLINDCQILNPTKPSGSV